MPTYEYRCKKCGKVFEYKQRMGTPALTVCPEGVCEHAGSGEVERLISKNVGVIFKGSGFYETDYKSKKKEPESAPAKECSNGCCSGACA